MGSCHNCTPCLSLSLKDEESCKGFWPKMFLLSMAMKNGRSLISLTFVCMGLSEVNRNTLDLESHVKVPHVLQTLMPSVRAVSVEGRSPSSISTSSLLCSPSE